MFTFSKNEILFCKSMPFQDFIDPRSILLFLSCFVFKGAVISGKVDLPQISGSFGEGNVSLPFVMDAKVNLY